jgi:TolB-like protein/DNA-binding winged helix-turn-helix (wHTH) protein/Tfp pilus assembly protein PilF
MNDVSKSTGSARFGGFEVQAGELRRQGVKIKIQEQPLQLLLVLIERAGEVVTREELQRCLWPSDTFVDFERGLNRAMNKVREALGDSSESPRWIETVPRRGYRFVAPVELFQAPDSSHAEQASVGAVGKTWRRGTILALAILLPVLGLGFAGVYHRFFVGPPIRSIAVLPLQNLSGDTAQQYFADGITDGIITEIARIRSLRVISRTSVMQYKATQKPLPVIAKELGVDSVVEGTILHSGGKVRITAQLIRASDDRHLWAEKYERSVDDTLKLQSEVAEAIASQIQARIAPQEHAVLRRSRRVNQQAFEAYVEGSYFGSRTSEESLNKSVALLRRAVELDTGYGQAYASLSHSWYVLGMLGMRPAGDAYSAAKVAARRALALDNTIAEAHNTLAEVERGYEFNWAAAEEEFKRALELNPNYALAHSGYAGVLSNMGRHQEAVAEAVRGRELDPVSVSSNTALGRILYRARRYDESIAAARKALELDPNDASPLWWIALSHEQKGALDQAIEELEKAVALSGEGTLSRALLANAYAIGGQPAKAIKILEELKTRSLKGYVSPVDLAVIYTGLRDRDSAFTWLTKAYEQRTMRTQQLSEPIFDSLRGDPRFQALARRLNLAT